jgi:large subunit ribosomal protein L25
MSELQLEAHRRTKSGKGEARRLRRQGLIPCILYGVEDKSVKITVNQRELTKILTGSHALIDLVIDGKSRSTVVKEIQYHPVKGTITHVDWMGVQAGKEIAVSVPIKFVGTSAGVKSGGIFQELKGELEITCLPKNMPETIDVDVSKLEIGDSIHVRDLQIDTFTIRDDADSTICSIVLPKKAAEVAVEEEEEIEEVEEEEPEVISKAKPEEGEEEG